MIDSNPPRKITIVGLGLIGGSIAAGLRLRSPESEICGVDFPERLNAEGAKRHTHSQVSVRDPRALQVALDASDLCVLCAPVGVIVELIPQALQAADAVTDCGSTKRRIMESVAACSRASRFVAGHPMAGAAGGSLAEARADLFEGRRWIVCEQQSDKDAHGKVSWLIEQLGAVEMSMSADEHDKALALTSHTPQVLASVLLTLAKDQGALATGGPAFERCTQGAGANEAMWRDIFSSNADEVAAALRSFSARLSDVADGLEREDLEPVLALLAAAGMSESDL
ncbi:MAG: prephenate dehydrogenase/arogenate dehydrogenase family protein [Polyangiaceae bacterium]|nr:prephenate dehydrogenase/arogenate dehydrogenase family protein [Polyangiaceae bacterium]